MPRYYQKFALFFFLVLVGLCSFKICYGAEVTFYDYVDNVNSVSAYNVYGRLIQTFNTGSVCNITKVIINCKMSSAVPTRVEIYEATSSTHFVDNNYNREQCSTTITPATSYGNYTATFLYPTCYLKQNTYYYIRFTPITGNYFYAYRSNSNLYADGQVQTGATTYPDTDLSMQMFHDDAIACPTIATSTEYENVSYDLRTYTTVNLATTTFTDIKTETPQIDLSVATDSTMFLNGEITASSTGETGGDTIINYLMSTTTANAISGQLITNIAIFCILLGLIFISLRK